MDILEKIIAQKHIEVATQKVKTPASALEKMTFFERPRLSLSAFLRERERSGVIAEFKRRSPSKGTINDRAEPAELAKKYVAAGASALSILTDGPFFGGSTDDILAARTEVDFPILRKEFIIDEYQILEARAIGADAILLLANVHNSLKIKELARFARSLELEILLELHNANELETICAEVACVGVNNRNLKDFSVSLDHSFRLGEQIPSDFVRVSESGLTRAEDLFSLRRAGFDGFLIGEFFMKTADPAAACRRLIDDFLALKN